MADLTDSGWDAEYLHEHAEYLRSTFHLDSTVRTRAEVIDEIADRIAPAKPAPPRVQPAPVLDEPPLIAPGSTTLSPGSCESLSTSPFTPPPRPPDPELPVFVMTITGVVADRSNVYVYTYGNLPVIVDRWKVTATGRYGGSDVELEWRDKTPPEIGSTVTVNLTPGADQ